ncbi:hypothetical protein EV361DRAFT_1033279 [Lentinula raphanica]|uniref:Uncharacterized protein n=1 Tax=Lentinula raphanica TaxID=153919 RepID=A0AA38PAK0_9AGAR|nr:hypothetical protein C8R42DRAFT_120542 [Lentinula raphanica]KAJ3753385.1 hypothetical protein EV360DRAFT_74566 [Lentinula raphanica]KAJ3775693.1 hypothetical protein FB446DRAFT_785814 [Lentinula raphanica]KAJ3825776.1 hypothetical protein F5880DRAFT_1730047 [Lentinula raphanica]KAJ3839345.1 hypothetical protein F5878DRAFT_124081 [Lentinula raphanica]
MFSKTIFGVLALVGSAIAQGCAEAQRFGGVTITPQPIVLGQEVTFEANFTCAIQLGYAPVYTDYTLVVPASNNSGFQPPVYFARRDGPSSGIDTFTVTFDPTYSAFVNYPDAQYEVVLASTHAAQNDSYGTTLTTGSVSYGVSITQASN